MWPDFSGNAHDTVDETLPNLSNHRIDNRHTFYSNTFALFEKFWADERVAGTPSAVEVVRSDEGREFKGDFAKLCRRNNISQEFTTADSAKFNGVAERYIMMVELAGMAAQGQAKSVFRAFEIPSGSKLWSARNY